MALLTADDIRYRKFASTRFREGYDLDEVDDFLEEVVQTVEELTRLAQGVATNTGTFSAIGASAAEINNSQVVQNLRKENAELQGKVRDLEAKTSQNNDLTPGAADSAEKEQLLQDNQELAKHLHASETQIAELNAKLDAANEEANRLRDASSSAQPAGQEVQTLIADLKKLQDEYNEKEQQNLALEQQVHELSLNLQNTPSENSADTDEIDKLREELSSVRSQLEDSNAHVRRLQTKLQDIENSDTGSLSAISTAASETGTNQVAAMLSMAQKLHDEYVTKGKNESAELVEEAKAENKRLLEEGQAEHDKLIKEAKEENERIIKEAKVKADETYESLASERKNIEAKIDELRVFEKDYRARLMQFLKNMLDDVDKRGIVREN